MRILGEVELFAWPIERRGGQHVNRNAGHVLAVHHNTGISVVETSERSQYKCRERAFARLADLLDLAEPGRWTIPAAPCVEPT